MTIDANAVARVIGVDSIHSMDRSAVGFFKLPTQVAIIGQASTAAAITGSPELHVTSGRQIGERYGFGSPIHLAADKLRPSGASRLGLGSVNCDAFVVPEDVAAVAATASLTPVGAHTGPTTVYTVQVVKHFAEFTVNDGEVAADLEDRIADAINANPFMPVIAVAGADVVNLTAKWAGLSSNDCRAFIVDLGFGLTFAGGAFSGGLTDPLTDIPNSLDRIRRSDRWYNLIVSCFPNTTEILDIFDTWGEGQWGSLVRKPSVFFTGHRQNTNYAALAATGDARKTDRTNSLMVVFDGVNYNLPCEIAAVAVARIATRANNNPATDYAGLAIDLVAPDIGQLPTGVEEQLLVSAGISTTRVLGTRVHLSDTVTFYHPDGEVPPAYRYVVDIVKLQNLIFNLRLIFEADEWRGAPLIPDDQETTNPRARSPKDAKAAIAAMIDTAGLEALISDPKRAKSTITAAIDSANPKRLNVSVTVQLSGNVNILDINLNFGFFFGSPVVL